MSGFRCPCCDSALTDVEYEAGVCPVCGKSVGGSPFDGSQGTEWSVRRTGLFMTLGGLIGIAVGVGWPLKQAMDHDPRVSYSVLLVIFSPMILCVGLVWLIGGTRGAAIIGKPYDKKMPGPLGAVLCLLFFVFGLMAWGCLWLALREYGYG